MDPIEKEKARFVQLTFYQSSLFQFNFQFDSKLFSLFQQIVIIMIYFEPKVQHAKISSANEALQRGDITVQQFLKRVTYSESKICNNFTDLENVADIDPEENEEFNDETDETEETDETNEIIDNGTSIANDINIQDGNSGTPAPCFVCGTDQANCVLIPCGHCLLCVPCWHTWDRRDGTYFGLVDSDDEDAPEERPANDDTHKTCPVCNAPIKDYVKMYLA